MSTEEKLKEDEDDSSHKTPQAITITIMDPSALETTTFRSIVSSSRESHHSREGSGSMVVVGESDDGTITVSQSAKDLLQTVTETHMGTEELPVISNINSAEDTHEQSTIHIVTKTNEGELEKVDEIEEGDGMEEDIAGYHCLICNAELQDELIPIFKTLTTTSHRKVSLYLGGLVGQKLTSRKAHSDIICSKCFGLLNKLDLLEVEIRDTKESIVNKYQETVSMYGGRARRRKPAAAKKSDFVFPKIEPENECEQAVALEMDETFEPQVDDLMEEEHDRKEESDSQDEDWEPEFKRPRMKRDASEPDPRRTPKRRRGRPRKDASKSKEDLDNFKGGRIEQNEDAVPSDVSNRPSCPVCRTTFTFPSQLRRHVRHAHPEIQANTIPSASPIVTQKKKFDDMHLEMDEESGSRDNSLVYNFTCTWCDKECNDKNDYDKHLKVHRDDSYKKYVIILQDKNSKSLTDQSLFTSKSGTQSSEENKDDTIPAAQKSECEKEGYDQCSHCGTVQLSIASLQHHLDECHGNASRTCALCNEHSADAASLREHLVHHFHGVLICPICPIKFSMRHHLISHLKFFHHDEYTVKCNICNIKFDHYDNFEIHQAECHDKGAMKECDICGEKVLPHANHEHFEKHASSQNHNVKSHHYACDICSSRFEKASHLYQHKNLKHADTYAFNCDECERKCRTERMLQIHKWGHKYGLHQCPVCRLKFRQVDQLKRHLLGAHPEQEGYPCKYCPQLLKNYATYIAHLKFKHPKQSGYTRPVRCKICGESFDHKLQWKYHMRTHTKSLQTCDVCGATVVNLDAHMNLHTKEKKFECSICEAVYHNLASLQFHIKRVHMGDSARKHLCNICGKSFLTPADQRIHVSRVHQGERNFWCSTCNKGYKSKVSLTYHQRLHTGEKPHKCYLCWRSFHVPSYLKRHLEHDHRAQYPGVYFKQGRAKTQEAHDLCHQSSQLEAASVTTDNIDQNDGSIPEIVQITVPMEVGEEEIAAVNSVQNVPRSLQYAIEEGVVFVVCEKIDM